MPAGRQRALQSALFCGAHRLRASRANPGTACVLVAGVAIDQTGSDGMRFISSGFARRQQIEQRARNHARGTVQVTEREPLVGALRI